MNRRVFVKRLIAAGVVSAAPLPFDGLLPEESIWPTRYELMQAVCGAFCNGQISHFESTTLLRELSTLPPGPVDMGALLTAQL